MIKNDRQYRITKTQLAEFSVALEEMERTPVPPKTDPRIAEAYRNSLQSQVEELRAELGDYEDLSAGKIKHFIVDSFQELPTVLIQARIARSLTQKQLAEKLGAKEQQIQRWEANDYAGASLETLKVVVEALGIETQKEFFIPDERLSMRSFVKNIEAAGLTRDLVFNRLFPDYLTDAFVQTGQAASGFREIVQAASLLSRVFSTPLVEFLQPTPPKLNFAAIAQTRFKLPARRKRTTVDAYAVYANSQAKLSTLVNVIGVPSDVRVV